MLVFSNFGEQSVDLEIFHRATSNFALEQQALLFKLLLGRHSFPLEVLNDLRYEVIRALVHEHFENPRLATLDGPEFDLNLVVGSQTVVDALDCWQRGPGQQFGDIFNF